MWKTTHLRDWKSRRISQMQKAMRNVIDWLWRNYFRFPPWMTAFNLINCSELKPWLIFGTKTLLIQWLPWICMSVTQTNAQVRTDPGISQKHWISQKPLLISSFTKIWAQCWYRLRMQWRAAALCYFILIYWYFCWEGENGLIHILTMWECVPVAYKTLTFICAEESNLSPPSLTPSLTVTGT